MTMCEPLSSGGEANADHESMLFAADSPVSQSAMRAHAWRKLTPAGYGDRCGTSSQPSGQLGSSRRTCPVCDGEVLPLSSLTSDLSDIAPEPATSRLARWAHHTHVSACSYWPTPKAKDGARGGLSLPALERRMAKSKTSVDLGDALGGPPNPEWVEWLMGFPAGWTDVEPSETP